MSNRPRKVLVVDDDVVDQEGIARLLGGELTVVSASTAAEAREQFERHAPDCILLDYRLPDVHGLELLEHFAERGAVVVVLTGQGSESVAVEAMKQGAYDYLVKGTLDRDSLRRAVFGAINHHSLTSALGRSESYNRALLSAVPDTILRVHADGHLLDFLPGQGAALPLDLGAALGAPVEDVVPGDLAKCLRECSRRAFAGGGVHETEFTHERDGRRHTLEVRVTACGSDDVLVIIRDVTRERELERRMSASQRLEAMGRLAGSIAHDFRNILAMIESCTALLLEELDDPQGASVSPRDDIAMILDMARRGTKLTAQLLTFGRSQVKAPEAIELDEKIRELEPLLRLALTRDSRLVVESNAPRGFVQMDPSQLDQILMNLVANARDAVPEGGRVTIATEMVSVAEDDPRRAIYELAPGRYCALSVADTGEGMDEDTAQHVFEPFFTTKPEGQGTGLGLATVYGIVQQNRGHIDFTSQPGRGTQFTILLPAVDGDSARGVRYRSSPRPGDQPTVLVVDDEEFVCRTVGRILTRSGYRVLEAREGQSALAIVESHEGRIDLLLTDLVMPRISGSELARRVVARDPGIEVLFMSGHPEDVVVEHGVSPSEGTFLAKPFEIDVLRDLVHKTLCSGRPVEC